MIRSPFTLVGLAAGVLMVVVPTAQAQYTAQPRPADAPAQVGGASQANPQINTAPEQNQNPFAAFNNPATRLRMMKMAFLKISNGPGGRGGSPFGRGSVSSPAMLVLSSTEIQEELGLKDKQKQDLQTLADRAAQQRQDLFTQMRNQSRRGDNNAPGSSSNNNNNNGRGRGGPGGGVDFRTVMQTMQTMESQRDAKMLGVLTAKQRDRLEEIILQIEGPLAIATDSKVAKKVGVASSQNSKLKSVVANLQASLQPGGGPGGPGGPGGGPPGAPGSFQGRGGPGGPGGPAAAPGGFQGRGGPGGPGGPTAAPSGFQGRGGPGGPGGQVAAGGFQGRGGPGGPTAAPGGPGGQVATGGGGERPSGFQGRSERGGDRGGDRGQRDPERDAERRQQFMDRMKEMMDSQDQAIAKAEADVEAILNPVQKQKFAKAKGKEVDLNAISESLAAATTSRFGRGGGQDGPPGSPTNSGSPREGTTTSSPAPRGR